MTPPTTSRSASHERQRSQGPSPRPTASNLKNRDGPIIDIKGVAPSHTNRVRPRKSVDELGRAPDRPAIVMALSKPMLQVNSSGDKTPNGSDMSPRGQQKRAKLRSPWACSMLTFITTLLAALLAAVIARSFLTRQLDPKGAAMSYMRPAFVKFPEFDTEHTRFASKYSLYLYREGGIDEDPTVKGVPVLFIPGNAGSYKQVRPVAAEAAVYFHEQLHADEEAIAAGKRPLDFFSVDFNEDFTAFHGQTMLDQAEYLNEAVAYILSLYHSPHRSQRDSDLPDPTSVILIGHSMGGIVARTMLTMPNYQANSINTIITLAAPHARAPVSFDADIISTYKHINNYWRHSYSQQRREKNPLASVSLVSIAGGGLDTIVPSDYATLASLVPESNGFTVFTSTMPHVWTGMDHLAITWCDQLRRSIVRALYDVVDATRPNQTRILPERMRAFKKRFLTGMEDTAERSLTQETPSILLTLDDNSNAIISQGERLVLDDIGTPGRTKAHLLPLPPQGSPDKKRFILLTNELIGQVGGSSRLEVMFCSVYPLKSGGVNAVFSMNMDLSGDTSGSTRLACKSAAVDSIALPASLSTSRFPFDEAPPFSFLQYELESLAEHQFVAVVEKGSQPTNSWVIAEFSSQTESAVQMKKGLQGIIRAGLDLHFPPNRPLVNEIHIPSVYSSLLAYKLRIERGPCANEELFTPLVRQHIPDPHESKFFVNAGEADISMHGVAPYMPPSLQAQSSLHGLGLQIWSDPTCNTTMEVSLKVDVVGSMGKLWMRYRTVFAAFPLIVVSLALRKQFKFYDKTGVFMSFSESMDQCLRRSIPVLIVALTFLAVSFSRASQASTKLFGVSRGGPTETPVDFTVNDLLLGSQDPFFWFLIPMFGLISIGTCIFMNYAVLSLTLLMSLCCTAFVRITSKERRYVPRLSQAKYVPTLTECTSKMTNIFSDASPRTRILCTSLLLVLVSTVIPYQFVFVVLCFVQISTCIRALRLAQETVSVNTQP